MAHGRIFTLDRDTGNHMTVCNQVIIIKYKVTENHMIVYRLFVLDRNTGDHSTECKNDYRIKNWNLKKRHILKYHFDRTFRKESLNNLWSVDAQSNQPIFFYIQNETEIPPLYKFSCVVQVILGNLQQQLELTSFTISDTIVLDRCTLYVCSCF